MIEVELKRLSDNIEHLNKLLEAMAETAKTNAQSQAKPQAKIKASSEPKQEPAETPAPAEEMSATTHTADSIKSLALAINKKDRTKRDAIKAKLAEHGAKVATDLSGDALTDVGEWLEALKVEVGA